MTNFREWMVGVTLAFLWACGSPEQATIDQFFRAAQADDSTTLAYMSAVGPPVQVASWKVVEVSNRTTEPYTLPRLLDQFEIAKKDRNAGLEERKKYFNENQDALEQIIPKLQKDPEYKFKGKLAPVQEEWMKLTEDRKEKEGIFQDLKRTVDRETGIASKSVMRQTDVGKLEGNIAVTEVLVNIKDKEGAELPFKVKLRRYDLSEPGSDRVESARWIVADFEGASPEAKAAAAAYAKANEPTRAAEGPSGGTEPAAEHAAAPEAAKPAMPAKVAESPSPRAEETKEPAEEERNYLPKELRGVANVQILTPATKVVGDEVVSTIRVRNASKDWITGFTATEHWYDNKGNAVGSGSNTHHGRFMPGQVIELELKTRKGPDFYQNQYEFTHANGQVKATVVESFPKNSD